MPLNTAKIADYSGGLNTMDNAIDLEPNEWDLNCHDIEVLSPDSESFTGRRGVSRQTTNGAAMPGAGTVNALTSMESYRLAGAASDRVIAATPDGAIYTIQTTVDPSTVVAVLAASGGGLGGRLWMFKQNQDSSGVPHVWCLNGVGTPQKYNISTAVISNWGGTPPNGTILQPWKNMMIVSGVSAQPQRLYYSAINNPESWPAANFIDIKSTDDEGDEIIALQVVGENLVVLKRRSLWIVFDSVGFENRRVADVGCVNRFATAKYLERVYWMSHQGVFSTDGDAIKDESVNIRNEFTPLMQFGATEFRMGALAEGFIGVLSSFGVNEGSEFWYMDVKKTREDKQHPWFKFTSDPFPNIHGFTDLVTPFSEYRWFASISDPSGGGGAQQACYLFNHNRADDMTGNGIEDQSINAVYCSAPLALQGSENKERLRRVNIWATGPDQGSANIADYEDVVIRVYGTPLMTEFVGLGSFHVETKTIFGTYPEFYRVRPETRGRFHRIKIELKNCETIISDIELKYRGGKEH